MAKHSKKTFILGVGAQKCGTTWLYRYLKSPSHVNLGVRKEYHIWDSKYSCLEFSSKRFWQIKNSGDLQQYMMINIPGYYEYYFDSLIKGRINITGDITPSYASLTAAHYSNIKQRLEAKDFQVKVVFLMRDPVQRCWSAARMNYRDRASSDNYIMSNTELNELFQKEIYNNSYIARTRYEETIQNLEQVFDQSELYLSIYETMHELDNLTKLSTFCGVPTNTKFSDQVVNSSPSKTLTRDNATACYTQFKSTYEFCNARFPETKRHWQAYDHLDIKP